MRHMMKREKSFYTAELSDLRHCHNWREVIGGWLHGYRLMSRIEYGALLMRIADEEFRDVVTVMVQDGLLKMAQARGIPEGLLAKRKIKEETLPSAEGTRKVMKELEGFSRLWGND